MAKPTIAIMYDFDKTLSTTDMQEYDFIKNLGVTPEEFWGKSQVLTDKNKVDRILAYMYIMKKECEEKNIPLTREYLNECGKNIILYKGVTTWFDRIAKFADEIGCNVEHYIISSGITEIIEGTDIAKYFKKIYGCNFLYGKDGQALWPAMAVNYTLKTQYIYRISKGVLDEIDDENLNAHTISKRIPFENMIYIGDGSTDVPCMVLVKENGGKAIALYQSGNKQKVLKLVEDNRINYVTVADYREGSTLEKTVKLMLETITLVSSLKDKEEKQINYFLKNNEEQNEN